MRYEQELGRGGRWVLQRAKQSVLGQMADISAAQSRSLLWRGDFWSDRGREKGIFVSFIESRCFSRSSSPQQCAALVQILNHANRKKAPKINNRTYVFFPFPLYTPMFSKSKISVVLYRKANRTLHGDRKFPRYEWSVLIQIHLSIWEVLMIWQKV